MKRWAKRIGVLVLVLVGFAVAFVLSGYLLPSRIELGVDQTVAAPPEALFPLLHTHEGLARWWTAVEAPEGYPKLEVRYLGGPTEGPGLEVGFAAAGSELVFESWVLTASEPSTRVEYDVDFEVLVVHRTITLTPTAEGTALSWREVGEVRNPLVRWMTTLSGSEGIQDNFRAAIRALEVAAAQ